MTVRSSEDRLLWMPLATLRWREARAALEAGAALIALWRRRAKTRAHLRALEPYLLDDVGLSCAERAREARKPFWLR